MKKTFLVVYEKGKRNYGGFVPDVPGCISLGDTLDDIRVNLKEALHLYMETAVELGYPIPEPTQNQVALPIEGETDPKTVYVVEHLTIKVPMAKTTKPTALNDKKTPANKRRTLQAA